MAEDGAALFQLYCAACHGPNGDGGPGGQFPPLAGSEWLRGDGKRAAKILLHGVRGPIEVQGKTYDLEMPPQGAMLNDAQIAAILSHVRQSWGNQLAPISATMIAEQRRQLSFRGEAWTSRELLKLHPLENDAPMIQHLVSQVYLGNWKELPNLDGVQASNVEEENSGHLSIQSPRDHDFAIQWTGEIQAPVAGKYAFTMDADDAAVLWIDDQEILGIRGRGPMDGSRAISRSMNLEAGNHHLKVIYWQGNGDQGLQLAWKGPGQKKWQAFTNQSPPTPREPIMIGAEGQRPRIYRNFIAHTTPRAIGVGFAEGVNLAWSADDLGPELIWTGAFMDAGRHWQNRGEGAQAPAGDHVVELTKQPALPKGWSFAGYHLDPQGNPTFRSRCGDQQISDGWLPKGGKRQLVRQLRLAGGNLECPILLSDGPLKEKSSGVYPLGKNLLLHVSGAQVAEHEGHAALLLKPAVTATLTYEWTTP
jgi:PA14 domain/Cytochrome C oxidase, cbb3-type, subunit III